MINPNREKADVKQLLKAGFVLALLAGLAACGTERIEDTAPAWHGEIVVTANCEGVHGAVSDVYSPETVTVTWSPAQHVSAAPGTSVTITAHFTWSDSDETDTSSGTATVPASCGATTTTTEEPPSTSTPVPSSTGPTTATTSPATTSTVPSNSSTSTSTPLVTASPSPSTTAPPNLPTTTSVPTSETVTTTNPPNRPFCEVHPERCEEQGGVPSGVETG